METREAIALLIAILQCERQHGDAERTHDIAKGRQNRLTARSSLAGRTSVGNPR